MKRGILVIVVSVFLLAALALVQPCLGATFRQSYEVVTVGGVIEPTNLSVGLTQTVILGILVVAGIGLLVVFRLKGSRLKE